MSRDTSYTHQDVHRIIATLRTIGSDDTMLITPGEKNTDSLNLDEISQKTCLVYKTLTATEYYDARPPFSAEILHQHVYSNITDFLTQAGKSHVTYCLPIRCANNEFLTLICNTKGDILIFNSCRNAANDIYAKKAVQGAVAALKVKYPKLNIRAKAINLVHKRGSDPGLTSAVIASLIDPQKPLSAQIDSIQKAARRVMGRPTEQKKVRQAHTTALLLCEQFTGEKRQLAKIQAFRTKHASFLPSSLRGPSLVSRFFRFIFSPIDWLLSPSKSTRKNTTPSSAPALAPRVSAVPARSTPVSLPEISRLQTYFNQIDPYLANFFDIVHARDKILFRLKPNVHMMSSQCISQLDRYFEVTPITLAENQQTAYAFQGFKPSANIPSQVNHLQQEQSIERGWAQPSNSSAYASCYYNHGQNQAPTPMHFQTPAPSNQPSSAQPIVPQPDWPFTVS